jgi:hypothetical protein
MPGFPSIFQAPRQYTSGASKGAALAIDGSGNFTASVYSPRRVAAGVE